MNVLTSILLICAALLTLAWLLAAQRRLVADAARRFLALPRLQQVVLVLAVGVMTVCAQKSGTNENAIIELSNNRIIESAEASASGSDDSRRAAENAEDGTVVPQAEEESLSNHNSIIRQFDYSIIDSNDSASPSLLNLRVTKTIDTNDIARGYAFVEVRTNATVAYEMPTNGTEVGTWGKTGAYRDIVKVEMWKGGKVEECGAEFSFVWGEQVVTSLWAHTRGKVRPKIRDQVHEIVAVGTPMSCVPGEGRLWTAATTNGTWVITWENFVEGRRKREEVRSSVAEASGSNFSACTVETRSVSEGTFAVGEPEGRTSGCENGDLRMETRSSSQASATSNASVLRAKTTLTSSSSNPCESVQSVADSQSVQFVQSVAQNISAQIEFSPNGDFITRSNNVECVYRRVNPDDWDDDGIANEEDDEPMVAADETKFGPNQTLPDGANSNAYCWVGLVVPQVNAKVTFVGDGASNLADPLFIAKAGETNRVTLLIGKTYRVTCPLPFRIAAKSSGEIAEDWNGENEVELCWPVGIFVQNENDASAASAASRLQSASLLSLSSPMLLAASSSASTTHSFSMRVSPSGLGGTFDWTKCCCAVSWSGTDFSICC